MALRTFFNDPQVAYVASERTSVGSADGSGGSAAATPEHTTARSDFLRKKRLTTASLILKQKNAGVLHRHALESALELQHSQPI